MAASGSSTLTQTIASTLALLDQFIKSLTTICEPVPGVPTPQPLTTTAPQSLNFAEASSRSSSAPDALALFADTARLLHAHATKLSLLTINPPFTPTAISREICTAQTSILPSMLAAVTNIACPASLGQTMVAEMQSRARVAMSEFRGLVDVVRVKIDEEESSRGSPKNGVQLEKEKERVVGLTGVIWKGCDACVELKEWGVSGLLVKKAEEYKALTEDALEELKEWRDDDEDEGFDEGEDDDQSDGELDLGMGKLSLDPTGLSSATRENIKPLLEGTIKTLGLLKTLYTAACKHRFKRLPKEQQTKENLKSADRIMGELKLIPEEVDELAGTLYDGDVKAAKSRFMTLRGMSLKVIEMLQQGWSGEDEFGSWWERFRAAVEKVDEDVDGTG